MERNTVNKYIGRQYARWLEYASYQCALTGMAGEAADVLNEVLLMLLEKPIRWVQQLLDTPHESYTELDFYVLKMIRYNTSSVTSPYQHQYHSCPVYETVNLSQLELADEKEEEVDRANEILEQFRLVRATFEEMKLSAFARKVFEYRFILGESLASWPGRENMECLYKTYNRVSNRIKRKLFGDLDVSAGADSGRTDAGNIAYRKGCRMGQETVMNK
ncbi:MAG: hypothetical protein LIP00_12495 [Parabacteroides sp.]|nr:hypothetical protein [Parabacteroides sp.]